MTSSDSSAQRRCPRSVVGHRGGDQLDNHDRGVFSSRDIDGSAPVSEPVHPQDVVTCGDPGQMVRSHHRGLWHSRPTDHRHLGTRDGRPESANGGDRGIPSGPRGT